MLRLLALAPLLCLLVPPAHADENVIVDSQTIKACIDGADDPRDCIGEIADPCQDAPGGSTTPGISECLLREQAAWDVILNETYRQAMSNATEVDATYRDSGIEPSAADSLKAAQRAWIAYRDAECDRRYDLHKDGTMRSNVAAACLLDLTANRAIDFIGEQ